MNRLSNQEKQQLITAVDRIPTFRTTGIAFAGRGMSMIVRKPSMPAGQQTWIVLKEHELQAPAATTRPQPRQSHIRIELLNMGLSCGSAVLAGVAVVSGVGAAPVTGGASLGITGVAWAGAVATSAQCGIATGRVINEKLDPGSNERSLDSDEWYRNAGFTLDAISIAGGVAGLGRAAQAAVRLSRTSGRPLSEILKGITRAERKRLAQDLARYTGRAHTRRQFVRLARQGKIPKLFSQQQVSRAVVNQLLNSISSGLTLAGSASSGVVRQVTVYFVEDE